MLKLTKPYKTCQRWNVTQGFHEIHKAVDIGGKYGEDLVSPFNGKVVNITEDIPEQTIDLSKEDLRRGYGLTIQSIEDPDLYFMHWHTLPFFSVSEGETVRQGQPVCEMGNSGMVYQNGIYVEVDLRLIPPYRGTHTHCELYKKNPDGTRTYLDYLQYIDWDLEIEYDVSTFISLIIKNMLRLLKK